jgi:hypothetical protein
MNSLKGYSRGVLPQTRSFYAVAALSYYWKTTVARAIADLGDGRDQAAAA